MNNVEVKLFQEKIDAMFDVLQEMIYKEGHRIMGEINMHRRDKHLEYWNPTYHLEYIKKQDKNISELRKKMDEASKKLAELIKDGEENKTPVETKKD